MGKYSNEIIEYNFFRKTCSKYFEIRLANLYFIPNLALIRYFALAMGIIQYRKLSSLDLFSNVEQASFHGDKLTRLSTNSDGKPGIITDTLAVPLQMSTIPVQLRYG